MHGILAVPHYDIPSVTGGILVDGASEVAWALIPIWRDGNIRNIHVRFQAVTSGGTSDLDFRLETLNSDMQPSGTLWGTNTNVAFNLVDSDDNAWIRSADLTANAAVSTGDIVAAVIANPAANFGNFTVGRMTQNGAFKGFPYGGGPLRTNKGDNIGPPMIMLEYDDGSYVEQVPSFHAVGVGAQNQTLTTVTYPINELGVRFTAFAPHTVCGFWGFILLEAGADFRVNLYEDGNDTPLLTADFDGNLATQTTTIRHYELPFPDTYTLNPGTDYRLTVVPLTTNDVTIQWFESPYDTVYEYIFSALPFGRDFYWTERNRSGTTDPDTADWFDFDGSRLRLGYLYINDQYRRHGGIQALGYGRT